MARIIVAASGQSTAPARTFADWLVVYDEILTTRPFSAKTLGNRRNSLRQYLSELSRLLAVRVTENAARSGEH